MGKWATQQNLKTINLLTLFFFSVSLYEVKTVAQRLRSNGCGDEKSRSPRVDRERRVQDTEIREKEQMKDNLP